MESADWEVTIRLATADWGITNSLVFSMEIMLNPFQLPVTTLSLPVFAPFVYFECILVLLAHSSCKSLGEKRREGGKRCRLLCN